MDSQYSKENCMESHTEDANSITTEERDENSSESSVSEEEQSSIITEIRSEEELGDVCIVWHGWKCWKKIPSTKRSWRLEMIMWTTICLIKMKL